MQLSRKRVAEILEVSRPNDRLGVCVDVFLIFLITVNVLAIILESVASFEARYRQELYAVEVFSVIVFTIEYFGRVWSCVDVGEERWRQPLTGRIRYILTPAALIDLIAILPFYLAFIKCRSETIRQKLFGFLERLHRLSELTTIDWSGDRPEGTHLRPPTA